MSEGSAAAPGAGEHFQLPAVNSVDRLHFSMAPTNEQLVALLGAGFDMGLPTIQKTAATFALRQRTFPLKYVIPWMAFIFGLITGMPVLLKRMGAPVDLPSFYWLLVLFVWIVMFPMMAVIFFLLTRGGATAKAYCEADLVKRTLAMPRVGVTIPFSQIECVTVVQRWYWMYQWRYIVQTAVLSRDVHGGWDYYPVMQAKEGELQTPLGDRLGAAIGVEVRHIQKTLGESRNLSDAKKRPEGGCGD